LRFKKKKKKKLIKINGKGFDIHRGVHQRFPPPPLSPILYNLFINDTLDNFDEYNVSIGDKKKMMWKFKITEDIILITSSKENMISLRSLYRL